MRLPWTAILIAFAVVPEGLAAAAATEALPGRQAPRFELPTLDGTERIGSADIFATHEMTFLVFWNSRCPACLESLRECQRFYARVSGGDVNVIGINVDEREDLAARGAVAAYGVSFSQLRDRGGEVAARYGVPVSALAVFLVDGGGVVRAGVIDPKEDAGLLMERMLLGDAPGDVPAAAPPLDGRAPEEVRSRAAPRAQAAADIALKADARIKFISIDMRGADARGPYGERIEPGNALLQRFTLEATGRLNRHLSAGGILRAGNEGLEVLRAGPEYFDSEWGSAFALIEAGRLSMRIGYFALHMTPLTLMRWDWDDSPRIGGAAGCDCAGAVAGMLTVRSLEELGPDLIFEGGLGRYSRGEFETELFYAMPRRARDTKATAWQFGGEERAAYSLEIYGLQARWRRFDRRTGRFWGAGAHLLAHREDQRSIDPRALGYVPFEYYTGHILTATAEVPLASGAGLRGEWITTCRAKGHNLGHARNELVELDASGGSAGIIVEGRGPVGLRVDYLRLGNDFFSPFAALTYVAGKHGVRTAAELRFPGGWSTASLFYKRMRGLQAPTGAEKENFSFSGVTFDLDHPRGFGGGISFFDQGEWSLGEVERFDSNRRTFAAGLRHRFARQAWIEALYQRTRDKNGGDAGLRESRSEIFSLSLQAGF